MSDMAKTVLICAVAAAAMFVLCGYAWGTGQRIGGVVMFVVAMFMAALGGMFTRIWAAEQVSDALHGLCDAAPAPNQ